MSKVTSKLQLTLPKALADQYGIRPGDDLEWVASGESIRIFRSNGSNRAEPALSLQERIQLFDRATERQRRREATVNPRPKARKTSRRGWKREDLYRRDHSG